MIVAVSKRWQEGHWPYSDFYISFLPAVILFPLLACLFVVPKSIAITADSLIIAWPFRGSLSVPLDELEYYMEARLFMIQIENQPTQLIFHGGFTRSEWRAFVRELESRFPERKALWYSGTLLFGRRKP